MDHSKNHIHGIEYNSHFSPLLCLLLRKLYPFAFPQNAWHAKHTPKTPLHTNPQKDHGMNIWSQVLHIHKGVEGKQTPCTFFQLYLIIQCHNVVTHGESGYDWISVISEWNCTQVLPWAFDWLLNGPASSKEEFVLQTNFGNA